jgi:hypothetical protein
MARKKLRANSTNATLLGADFIIGGVVSCLFAPPAAFTFLIDEAALDELEHYGNTIFALNCVSKEVNRCVISGINMIRRDMPPLLTTTFTFRSRRNYILKKVFELSRADRVEADRLNRKPAFEAQDIRSFLTIAHKIATTVFDNQINYIQCKGRPIMRAGAPRTSITISIQMPPDMCFFVFLSNSLPPIEHLFAVVQDIPSATVLQNIDYVFTHPRQCWFPVVMRRTLAAMIQQTFPHVRSLPGWNSTDIEHVFWRIQIPFLIRIRANYL